MHIGALKACGEILWFLHADTVAPPESDRSILNALDGKSQSLRQWGRFNVRLSGSNSMLRFIEYFMNLRSRVTGIATGDQGIFVRRDVYVQLGGFPDQPLMEDIEMSKRLRKISRPACLTSVLITSSRRWEKRGLLRTVLLMWALRAAYSSGVSARRLAYYYD
jgi:rSAM/selenodomain-associated transferase 2